MVSVFNRSSTSSQHTSFDQFQLIEVSVKQRNSRTKQTTSRRDRNANVPAAFLEQHIVEQYLAEQRDDLSDKQKPVAR